MDVKEAIRSLRGRPYSYILTQLDKMLHQGIIDEIDYKYAQINSAEWHAKPDDVLDDEGNVIENKVDSTPINVTEDGQSSINVAQLGFEEVKTQTADNVVVESRVEDTADTILGDVDPAADESTEETADENNEENADETPTKDTAESQDEKQEEQTSETTEVNNAQWVSDYQGYLQDWSDRNPDRGIEELEAKENSLKVKFKDDVALKFSSPSNVAVKAKDPSSPKASDFDALMEVAKKSNQDISLSYDKMSEPFRHALIEACAKSGVCIRNLQDEDIKLYADFVLQQNETNLNDDVEQVVDQEEQVVETVDEPETTETEDDIFNFDSSDETSSSEEVIELPESLERPSEVAEPAAEEPAISESVAEEDEIVAEEAPRLGKRIKGFIKEKIENVKETSKAKVLAAVTSVTLLAGGSAAVLSGCANKTSKDQNADADGYESFIDTTNSTPSDSTFVATADSLQQAADTTNVFSVPTEWNENMGISERDYNITRKACGDAWETMYTNAHLLKATLSTADNQMTEAQILLATRNIVAWTTSPNANGEAKINSGILKRYGLDNLVNALRCGDTLTVENITYYQSMLKAGNNGRLNLQVSYLAEINGRFAMLRHNSEGYLIGNTCNQFKEIGDCGQDAKFAMCDCGPNVTEHVEQVINQLQAPQPAQVQQQDTTQIVATPDTVVNAPVDTAQVEKAAPAENFPDSPWVGLSFSTSTYGNPVEGRKTIQEIDDNSNVKQTWQVRRATRQETRRLQHYMRKNGTPMNQDVAKSLETERSAPNTSRQEAQEALAKRKAATQNTAER